MIPMAILLQALMNYVYLPDTLLWLVWKFWNIFVFMLYNHFLLVPRLVIIINSWVYPNNVSTFFAFLKLTIIYDEIASKNVKGNVRLRMKTIFKTMIVKYGEIIHGRNHAIYVTRWYDSLCLERICFAYEFRKYCHRKWMLLPLWIYIYKLKTI